VRSFPDDLSMSTSPTAHVRPHDVSTGATPEPAELANPAQLRLLSSTRGAVALLAPVHGDALSLVVGSGWGAIARAISELGGRAVGIDLDLRAMAYANAIADPTRQAYVCSDPLDLLPFASASFDNVFLADRFSSGKRVKGAGDRPDDTLDTLIEECRRVLKPGGTLVMEAPNRLSFLNLAGKSSIGASGGRLELVPRSVARFYLSHRGRANDVGQTRTHPEYAHALRNAGFVNIERYVPWPDRLQWSRLWPVAKLVRTPLPLGGERRRDQVAGGIFWILRRLHLQQWFVPDYVYLARKGVNAPGPPNPSVIELVWHSGQNPGRALPEIRAYQNSGSVLFADGDQVFKVPLTRSGRARLWREKEALGYVARHPVGAFAIRPIGYRMEAGVRWAVYPRVKPTGGEGRLDSARKVLHLVLDSSTMESLHETDAWRRLCDPATREALRRVDADALLHSIERITTGVRVPVGLIHGDFALHNILHGSADEPVVIDWDRSERHSPVLLDVLAASHFHAFRTLVGGGWGMGEYWAAWQLHFAGDERLAFGREIERARGELEWPVMVAFAVLNTVHWNCLEEGPASRRKDEMYRSWTAECQAWISAV
jgi:SAM-dependent methyltransferase